MKSLKAGIIGLGVGEKHIEAYGNHSGCHVVALCDFSDEKIRYISEKYPTMKITKNANDIIDDPAIDIVSIASFDNFHYEQIVRAIQNRKHIFVEKPLCLYRDEALSIKRMILEKPGIRLSSNLNLRTCPRFGMLKKAVISKKMGELFYLEGDYLWGRLQKLRSGWRKDMPFYSIVHGAAVHMIDLLMWITGMKPTEVQGYGSRMSTKGSGMNYNDFAVILMKFKNGMTAKVTANGGCVHPHFHRVAVFGTEQTFVHEISGSQVFNSREYRPDMMEAVGQYPAIEEKKKVITTFVDSIIDNSKKPVVTCDDVFETMAVCYAAETAIQEKRPVRVEYI
ncbi:Gfo/Idh/MocA family protein [Thermodesulfobacteriota bacterium]